ncbi:hypothetical protein DR999_PMT07304 [Platysternon megacephalum]|uniref:Uncharacterized protein n=1 Tax=Platysternon megacephalum TaxID=55544 RepID=A0A4D9EL53_9SAUR|nr:hypothetical protein DR999_PMT07304 [Platysternon megacephalum]
MCGTRGPHPSLHLRPLAITVRSQPCPDSPGTRCTEPTPHNPLEPAVQGPSPPSLPPHRTLLGPTAEPAPAHNPPGIRCTEPTLPLSPWDLLYRARPHCT